MEAVYIKEYHRYTFEELNNIFKEKTEIFLKRLKECGIVKTVDKSNDEDISELTDDVIEYIEVDNINSDTRFVFTFVGIIVVDDFVLKCYPKYLSDGCEQNKPKLEKKLNLILQTYQKYNGNLREQLIKMYDDGADSGVFNELAVMLFLLNDYYEHGIYVNNQDIIEINGTGDILWDRTVNETIPIISKNKPYYTQIKTRKKIADESDVIKRLHERVISKCSFELNRCGLDEMLGLEPVYFCDGEMAGRNFTEDEKEFYLYRLQKEISIQFNTKKQRLLQALYVFIKNSASQTFNTELKMFGTTSFNTVWEKVCAAVLCNMLDRKVKDIFREFKPDASSDKGEKNLLEYIEKPKWVISNSSFAVEKDTFIPDVVNIQKGKDGINQFRIYDAKYYDPKFEDKNGNKNVADVPGVESIAKQYFYQLAYKELIEKFEAEVINCFLFPTEDKTERIGEIKFGIFEKLGLSAIQIIMLNDEEVYSKYLSGENLDIPIHEKIRVD